MAEKNPLEPLLDQIAEILKTFDENKGKQIEGDPTSQDVADMINVMNRVDALKKAYEITKKEQGLTEEDIQKTMRENRDRLSEKDQRLLDKIAKMRSEAKLKHDMVENAVEQERRKKVKSGRMFKKGKKRKSKAQKSLSISFRKGWKKL
jgi:hypothetical protein